MCEGAQLWAVGTQGLGRKGAAAWAKVRCGGAKECYCMGEGALRWGEGAMLMGGRWGCRGGSAGKEGEMDRMILKEELGRRAAQKAQQVGQKSLVKRNFAV